MKSECKERLQVVQRCEYLFGQCEVLSACRSAGFKVAMKEGSDAVLPCLISTAENIVEKIFDWEKDGQRVFIYRLGSHSNNGHTGQDEQFRGRVSHFQDQLKKGNASIKIQNVKMADSGNYSCIFPQLQLRETFYIQLVVGEYFHLNS
ncbi:myelin-oligodendrocyte glycoprotein-like isoform X2 [Sparus aurata]|uniref:myelin-oligodendrocyte glycoprotein-like isoform X2 n=1 Tax=Sparus aurata TaxID=8175 RepID=UPI0011C11CE7|nr:myelin-oligodendrocyte glycoprotein-like isoform X2 [Sparus aurata]